jgi:hypothetical protein
MTQRDQDISHVRAALSTSEHVLSGASVALERLLQALTQAEEALEVHRMHAIEHEEARDVDWGNSPA